MPRSRQEPPTGCIRAGALSRTILPARRWAARTASRISGSIPLGRHQHGKGRGGGSARRRDVLAQRAGRRSERCSSSPAPSTVARASRSAGPVAVRRCAGPRQALDEVEHIGGAGARHRRDGVDQVLAFHPLDPPDARTAAYARCSRCCVRDLCARRSARHAPLHGGRQVRHGADDGAEAGNAGCAGRRSSCRPEST